jgi:hypothetical protein
MRLGVMVGVASADVAAKRQCDLAVAGVVRCVQHEFAQWSEVALGAIQASCQCRLGTSSILCAMAHARICGGSQQRALRKDFIGAEEVADSTSAHARRASSPRARAVQRPP